MRWVMQYRTRLNEASVWGEWKSLPEQLTFSSYYHPAYFQFRTIQEMAPAFTFSGVSVNEEWKLKMILISAVPLKRGPLYDYRNEHFINPDEIKFAVLNEHFVESQTQVNVTLKDNSEWIIPREVFDAMRLFYTKEDD